MNALENFDTARAERRHSRQIGGLDDGQRRKADRRGRSEVYWRIVPEHCLPAERECHLFRQGRLARWEAAGVRDRDRARRGEFRSDLRSVK